MENKEVRRIREGLGLTQIEMAKKLKITQSYLSRLETGPQAVSRRVELEIKALRRRAK